MQTPAEGPGGRGPGDVGGRGLGTEKTRMIAFIVRLLAIKLAAGPEGCARPGQHGLGNELVAVGSP